VAALQAQFEVEKPDAEHILAALARCQALHWEATRGLSKPCPGVLELCGDWLIQPERLHVQQAQLDRA
jgi:hypothetical protein